MYARAWEECLRRERAAIAEAKAGHVAEAMATAAIAAARAMTIEFRVQYNTAFGQDLRLVGSVPQLGGWDLSRSLPMTWSAGNVWFVKVDLPHDAAPVEYKYVVTQKPAVRWEEGRNHIFQIPSDGTAIVPAKQCVQDCWGM